MTPIRLIFKTARSPRQVPRGAYSYGEYNYWALANVLPLTQINQGKTKKLPNAFAITELQFGIP